MKTLRPVVFTIAVVLGVSLSAQGPRRVALGDWPEMRGPNRDGVSLETGLIDRWAIDGENFLWRVPHGGRSAPIVMGDRVYVQNPAARGDQLQERVMALDANTGRTLWEYRFNIYQSDVPPHRVGWASPAADPETGNVYALSGGAEVIALSPDGKLLWDRSIGEEFAAFTTHGGRTMSPLVDGDLVIVSAAVSNWGIHGNRAHRFIALDKRTGDIVYVSNPGGRPYDTAYASPLIATINGTRMLIVGLGDGGIYAIKPQTGEKIWGFVAAKRGINTGVAVDGTSVFISHGDENLDENTLGMVAAIDGSATGEIKMTKWAHKGVEFGYSSPIAHDGRLYQLDNSSTLHAFETETGRELWTHSLGVAQKAPLVMADGKFYVGTDTGRFFIIRPHADRAEVLSSVTLPNSTNSCCGSEGTPEQILGGAAVSRGRIFFVSSDAVYAIGPKAPTPLTGYAVDTPAVTGEGEPTHLQVAPTEIVATPGQPVTLEARLFDSRGRFLRETTATWSVEGLRGTMANGTFTPAADAGLQAGLVKATANGLTGEARVRVTPTLPWDESFSAYADGVTPPGWVSTSTNRLVVATLDGEKVLHKEPLDTIFKRARVFFGPSAWANYTFEADVRAAERRRQMADVGITVQRYSLVLYGTSQRLKIEPWEPETTRTVTVPFSWKPDTWYRLKLRVQNEANGAVRVQGKAWPRDEPEPSAWTIEKADPIGNRKGAPGLFIDAQFGAHFDNFKLTPNP